MIAAFAAGRIPVDRFDSHRLAGHAELVRGWNGAPLESRLRSEAAFGVTLLAQVDTAAEYRRGIGGTPARSDFGPDRLLLLPPAEIDYVIGGMTDAISLFFPNAFLVALGLASERLVAARGLGAFDDRLVPGTMRALHTRAAAQERDALFEEQAMLFVLAAIAAPSRTWPPAMAARPQRLRLAIDYIEAHLDRNVGLRELARLTGLSVAQFCRAFRAETGEAPHAYRNRRRIERAQHMLHMPRPSALAELSVMLGFSSQSHFATTFRRLVGTTPTRWRDGAAARSAP